MLVLLLIGAQGAWADLRRQNNTVCSPKIHFKVPDNWVRAYIVIGGSAHPMGAPDENGWVTIDVGDAKAVGTNNGNAFVINSVNDNTCQQKCVTPSGFGVKENNIEQAGFTCRTFETGNKSWVDGGEVWIQDHPDVKQSGKTYITYEKPNVKDFYVFLPNTEEWKSAEPRISETYSDGKTKDVAMYNDGENCGWYYRRYIDEPLPASVIIHRDDDETQADAIGMNGAWEESGAATPIALEGLFDLYSGETGYNDALYFVADAEQAATLPGVDHGWYVKRPAVTGKCGYDLAAVIYDTDASLHGAFTCNPDWFDGIDGQTPGSKANACFYPSAKYNVISDEKGVVPCIGVTTGMVEDTLTVDPTTKKKRMKLTTIGKKCFGSQADEAFAAMFNYTPGVNENYCFNMPFEQAADGKFEFESDYFQSPGATVPGGFYPAEEPPTADKMMSERLEAAEYKRKAEGPVYFCGDQEPSTTPLGLRTIDATEGVPKSDLMCNGPGWDGGVNCDGYFKGGTEFNIGTGNTIGSQISRKLGVTWEGDGWAWSCEGLTAPENWPRYASGTESAPTGNSSTYRWTSGDDPATNLKKGGRNQHFCFESHASFRFKKGLKFSFRGDDDIWVFIGNKLAVDLGGTHLAAPGYVDLDKFMPKAEVGKNYPIDIYFCDRRTTMSNVHIKTNMFIEQKTGITTEGKQDTKRFVEKGDNVFKICYMKSGGGSCSAAMGGGTDSEECGPDISEKITYLFTQDKTGQDPTKTKVPSEKFETNPVQYNGGIDVTTSYAPVINEEILENYLASGKYYLIIKIGSDQKAIEVNIKGQIGVANREAVTVDENGNQSIPSEYKSQAMASQQLEDGSVDIKQLIPLYIAGILDPCNDDKNCKDPLELQRSPESAYTLQVSNSKAVFYEMKNGKLSVFNPSAQRKISKEGIDTIYVTIPSDNMESSKETVKINVAGSTRTAELLFFLPRIVFVDTDSTYNIVSADPDNMKEPRLKGMTYYFYIVALNGDDSPCTECNFKLTRGSKTSSGVDVIGGAEVVNGRATIAVQSSKVYEKCSEPSCLGAATLHVIGNGALVQATYGNLQFSEPPVPTPIFADIFDVHGETPATELNIRESEYFRMTQEYLDGIGDSVAVYYIRNFHKDSLPDKIAVFWENDKDSVVYEHAEIVKGSVCGSAAKLPDTTCLNRITLGGGKKFSKNVKTDGLGSLKSWATYTARGKKVTSEYSTVVYDRIAPIIVSARAVTDTSGKNGNSRLKLVFSEEVAKTAGAPEGDKVFSFYINSGNTPVYKDHIDLNGVTLAQNIGREATLIYSQATGVFPQSGDYIHFRSLGEDGLITDQSEYASAPGGDSLRPKDDATFKWNVATGYNAKNRLPSPWVLISGDVSAYAERFIPSAYNGIPLSPSEAANLPASEVFAFDANKEPADFFNAIANKNTAQDSAFGKYGYIPHGWYVKTDMGALIESKEEYAGINKADVYFDYEIQLFTNLGSHVMTQKGRISCTDQKYFKGDCVQNRKNFYIAWNMKSDKDRLVGTGAYISKLKSYVQLSKFGKKNKNDKSEMWGVRHNSTVIGASVDVLGRK